MDLIDLEYLAAQAAHGEISEEKFQEVFTPKKVFEILRTLNQTRTQFENLRISNRQIVNMMQFELEKIDDLR